MFYLLKSVVRIIGRGVETHQKSPFYDSQSAALRKQLRNQHLTEIHTVHKKEGSRQEFRVCVYLFSFLLFFLLFWSFTLRVIGLLFGFVKYLFQAPPALFHFFTRRKTHNWSFLCVALSNRTMIIFCLFKKFSRVKTCEKYTINKIQKHCSVLHNVL